MKKAFLFVTTVLTALTLSSCNNASEPVTPPSPSVKSVEITKLPTKTTYNLNEEFDPTGLEVTALYNDDSSKVVTDYTLSDVSTATAGDKEVVVTYKRKTASFTINVVAPTVNVESVSLDENELSLVVGGNSVILHETVLPENASNKSVTWASNDSDVATVENGVVTPVGEGTATITVTTVDGAKSAQCRVSVIEPEHVVNVVSVSLSPKTLTFTSIGATKTLTATVLPSDATDKSVAWFSSDDSVATVDSHGVVTSVSGGTATITVTTTDGSKTDTCAVTVSLSPLPPSTVDVTSVSLSPKTLTLTVGGATGSLSATVLPSNATDKSVSWSSSDNSVATVNDGVVSPVAAGTATITVTTTDHGFTDTCTVTVNAAPAPVSVTSVSLTPKTLDLTVGGSTGSLTATVLPSNASDKSVSWETSDNSVATVANGVVTPVGAGTATITVTTTDGGFTDTCTVTVTGGGSGGLEYTLVQSDSDLKAGDTYVVACSTYGKVAKNNLVTTNNAKFFEVSTSTFSSDASKITSLASDAQTFKLGGSSGAWTFQNENDEYLICTAAKKVEWSSSSATWTISISSGAATITYSNSSFGRLVYNNNNGNGRVTTYTSNLSSTMVLPQLYKVGEAVPVDPTGIVSLNPSSLNLTPGKAGKQVSAVFAPSNANQNLGLMWSSSDESVATVTQSGVVAAATNAQIGDTATITATSTFNENFHASCSVTIVEEQKAAWTIMIYMCGSDLESGSGHFATSDINEILGVDNQPDDVNIIIETGGTSSWNFKYSGSTKIPANKLGRWHVENGTLKNDWFSSGQVDMGLQSTYESFLDWGLSEYPAEKVGVIFWNHGGAMQGVCIDENYSTYDSEGYLTSSSELLANEIHDGTKNALARAGLSKLEWVGYDACLMAMQDIATLNADYFNYMVSAQESESGYGWDYDNWVDDLYNKDTTVNILSAICDSFINDGRKSSDETLSVADLSKIDAYITAWENMSTALYSKFTSSNKESFINNLLLNCKYYGGEGEGYIYYGSFDAKDFINKLASNSTFNPGSSYTNAVLTAFNNLVIKNSKGSSAGNSNGLCLFYPANDSCYSNNYYTADMTKLTNWRNITTTYGHNASW